MSWFAYLYRRPVSYVGYGMLLLWAKMFHSLSGFDLLSDIRDFANKLLSYTFIRGGYHGNPSVQKLGVQQIAIIYQFYYPSQRPSMFFEPVASGLIAGWLLCC